MKIFKTKRHNPTLQILEYLIFYDFLYIQHIFLNI